MGSRVSVGLPLVGDQIVDAPRRSGSGVTISSLNRANRPGHGAFPNCRPAAKAGRTTVPHDMGPWSIFQPAEIPVPLIINHFQGKPGTGVVWEWETADRAEEHGEENFLAIIDRFSSNCPVRHRRYSGWTPKPSLAEGISQEVGRPRVWARDLTCAQNIPLELLGLILPRLRETASPSNKCAKAGGHFLNQATKRTNFDNVVCRICTPPAPVGVTGWRAHTLDSYPEEQHSQRKHRMEALPQRLPRFSSPWILVEASGVNPYRIKRRTVSLPFAPTRP